MPTVSHQTGVLLDSAIRGAVAGAAIKVLYQLPEDDAKEFASAFAKKPPPAETRREEKLTPVADLIYRIVPDAPAIEQMKRSPKRHPDKRVNEFIQNLIQRLQHSGGVKRKDRYKSGNEVVLSRIDPFSVAITFTEKLNTFLYEIMRDQNPHRELPVDIFEIMVRATAPAFFDRDGFEAWALEPDFPITYTDRTYQSRSGEIAIKKTFPRSLTKRTGAPQVWDSMSPYDYCSSLFMDGVGSYRLYEKQPEGLEGNALGNWFHERKEKVSEDLAQAYRLLWLATEENQLTSAFRRYEQVLRNVLKERWQQELRFYLQPDYFYIYDDKLNNSLLFPLYNVSTPEAIKDLVDRLILPLINQKGNTLAWQYSDYGVVRELHDDVYVDMYKPVGEHHANRKFRRWFLGEGVRNRLIYELDLDAEINRIVNEQKGAFEEFIREVREVFRSLALEPVAESSGVYEEKPGTQRTEQDMWNEMVREFQDLPRWRAYCRMVKEVNGEQVLVKYKLFPFPPSKADSESVIEDRISRIVEQSHTYCRLREDVDQEIAARQAELTRPIPQKSRVQYEEGRAVSSGKSSMSEEQREQRRKLMEKREEE